MVSLNKQLSFMGELITYENQLDPYGKYNHTFPHGDIVFSRFLKGRSTWYILKVSNLVPRQQ